MRYASAAAFRRALEDRLKILSTGDSARFVRYRKRIAFDRLLARLVVAAPGAWLLKGGFALDLRLIDRSRTTKDVDLAWRANADLLLDALLDAGAVDLGDHFVSTLELSGTSPDPLGGAQRFRVATSLAGRPFESFALDVGTDEGPACAEDPLTTPGLLAFAGIAPVTVPVLPLASQVAEKRHAYTRTYEGGRSSTRIKDLIDLALIASTFALDAAALRTAIRSVFTKRATHGLPIAVPPPPAGWSPAYRRLAAVVGIDTDLNSGHVLAAALLDPVLGEVVVSGAWDPSAQAWTAG